MFAHFGHHRQAMVRRCCSKQLKTFVVSVRAYQQQQQQQGSIVRAYGERVAKIIQEDNDQLELAQHLQRLDDQLVGYRPVTTTNTNTLVGKLTKLLRPKPKSIKGVYLHGRPGSGKTMMMDLFFENCCIDPYKKQRFHFHTFMSDLHERLHRHQAKLPAANDKANIIAQVSEEIASETWLLCLDEFQVTDIADAMILKLAFGELFARGLILVATSNCPPDKLYLKGLQREAFVPFIPMLKEHVDVLHLSSNIDYRRLLGSSMINNNNNSEPEGQKDHKVYYIMSEDTDRQLDVMFKMLSTHEKDIVTKDRPLTIKGRTINLPKTCGHLLDTTFEQLCGEALGAADYHALAQAFHVIILRNVPILSKTKRREEAKRFITMIDTFYDARVKLIMSAETTLDKLIQDDNTDGPTPSFSGEAEMFAFPRTLSRLIEMQSLAYWKRENATKV